jgi:hypothetical protein
MEAFLGGCEGRESRLLFAEVPVVTVVAVEVGGESAEMGQD